jgi:hypothetical protein
VDILTIQNKKIQFNNMKYLNTVKFLIIALALSSFCCNSASGQINTGCVAGGFGVNATVYAGENFGGIAPPAGEVDWFKGNFGIRNVIVQDQVTVSYIQSLLQTPANFNPAYGLRMNGNIGSRVDQSASGRYRMLIDAVWARDHFGGSGGIDTTAYAVSSKNAQDPAAWKPGPTNVLGKNDLIDVAGHMFRDIDSTNNINNLWFVGLINRAEPGGEAYMDFEFFIRDVAYSKANLKFTSGGPDMGHTAFRFDSDGNIIGLGDMIYNTTLSSGGSTASVELRIWVSRADYNTFRTTPKDLPFRFGPLFDGATTGAPYGYASVLPNSPDDICGYVNLAGQLPPAPPFGTKNTKANVYGTAYAAYSVAEVALNLTGLGLDNYLVREAGLCNFPWRTFLIKTRTSASFTSALKDFAGPYTWGQAAVLASSTNAVLDCANPAVTLTADPLREGSAYQWTTSGGNIIGSTNGASILVNKAGNYFVQETTAEGCIYNSPAYVVTAPANPLITGITSTATASCNGSDGSIQISVTGGTEPFSYSWSGTNSFTSTAKDLAGLAPGSYTVTVTDANGCSFTGDPVVVAAKTPVTYSSQITHIDCYGNTNGSIQLTNVTGGVAPLSFSWSNGKTTQNLLNVTAGNYTLTITDGVGCQTSEIFNISQPSAALIGSLAKTDDTDPNPSEGNGAITLTVTGGTPWVSPEPEYTYAWTGPNGYESTDKDLSGLKYGLYTVVITDANACAFSASVFIYEPEICFDGVDNDGDGLTDCNDSECVPGRPEIDTPENPCIGDIVEYTVVTPVDGLFYYWTYPSNVTDVSGQGSHTLSLKWLSTSPGQICVRAANAGPVPESKTGQVVCYSAYRCLTVSPTDTPQTPAGIFITE